MLSKSLNCITFDSNNETNKEDKNIEYKELKSNDQILDTTSGIINSDKNRYSNVLPFDHSRVRLKNLKNDYVNANFINFNNKEYISTQAPITSTFRDFWKMVWDQKSTVIVMLTDFIEGDNRKARKYWDNVPMKFTYDASETINNTEINIIVTLKSKIFIDDGIVLRKFNLISNGESHGESNGESNKESDDEHMEVLHIQYTNWKDHKTSSINAIKTLIAIMNINNTNNGLPIIHCSAGIGRSGTFICCDIIKTLILKRKNINIYDIVSHLRECRMGMVQTQEQYNFLYKFYNEVSNDFYHDL